MKLKKKKGKFPDLNKDGKITRADILKGRGVFKRGGKVEEPIKVASDIDFRTEEQKKKDAKAEKKQAKKDARAERKQDRIDKKGMIPAKYRNRGQAGLDRYIADMQKKRSRKNAKGLAKIFGTKAARKRAAAARKAANQQKRRFRRNSGAGCQGEGCGAYE